MKNKTVELFTLAELKEKFPDGYEKALSSLRESEMEDSFFQDEMMESLKALIAKAGFKLKDWNLGAYNRNNFLKVEANEELEELEDRNLEWFNSVFPDIEDCKLTGLCYDVDFLVVLRDSLKSGMKLKNSLENLERKFARLSEEELDSRCSEEFLQETAENNDFYFTSEGEME